MEKIIIIVSILIVIFIIRNKIKRKNSGDGSIEKNVSFENVKSTLQSNMECDYMHCPDCNLNPEELVWFKFRTSDASWEHLGGRAGYYSKCPNCKIVVDFIITIMN